ncbi:DUF488 family protein [Mycobacterium sp.]|uniref:DUF488 domain-containing protein n=1 Tax=Mycobacterium sp. TaxID=1785 RepID=UPI002D98FA20|nr:DUF488 domain-containing protein [Mycobacterium sp.]
MWTVGYQDRTVDDLIDTLAAAGVEVLVDVRLTPLSRKPGMSKNRLTARLAEAGIGYVHLPQLGNPRDNRDAFRRGESSARARYSAVLLSSEGRDALEHISDLAGQHSVALICFERNASECHRTMVTDALVELNPSLHVSHLRS